MKEDSTILMAELMKVIVVESVLRASNIAAQEYKDTIAVDHIEAILPQMVSLFSF